MNGKKLEKLLITLLQAQDDIGYDSKDSSIDRIKTNELFNRREDIRNSIASEFATLRQQRDALTEILEATASCSPCLRPDCRTDNPLCGVMIARAVLASIEGADDNQCRDDTG